MWSLPDHSVAAEWRFSTADDLARVGLIDDWH
jgi:hypothetical protein